MRHGRYERFQRKGAKGEQEGAKVDENECSNIVIGAAIEVHRTLGIGLLESAYELAMAIELEQRGLRFERQHLLAATYKGVDLGDACRVDLLVENLLIIEIGGRTACSHSRCAVTHLPSSGPQAARSHSQLSRRNHADRHQALCQPTLILCVLSSHLCVECFFAR